MGWRWVPDRWTVSRVLVGVGVAILVPLGLAALIVLGVQGSASTSSAEAVVIRAAPPAYGGTLTTVRYSVDGREYNEELTLEGSGVTVGQRITVHHDPEHPREITSDAPVVWVPILLGSLGVGFFVVLGGAGLLVRKLGER